MAKTRTSKIAFQALQFAFPASRRGLQIDAQLLVHAMWSTLVASSVYAASLTA
jgi:hypothetical protein